MCQRRAPRLAGLWGLHRNAVTRGPGGAKGRTIAEQHLCKEGTEPRQTSARGMEAPVRPRRRPRTVGLVLAVHTGRAWRDKVTLTAARPWPAASSVVTAGRLCHDLMFSGSVFCCRVALPDLRCQLALGTFVQLPQQATHHSCSSCSTQPPVEAWSSIPGPCLRADQAATT